MLATNSLPWASQPFRAFGRLFGVVTAYTVVCFSSVVAGDPPNVLWMKGGHRGLKSCDLTPNGQLALTGGMDDETIKIWRTSDGAFLRTINAFLAVVNDLDVSPDGQFVAAVADSVPGSGDAQIKIFRISDGALIQPIDAGFANCTSVAYSPDGTRLVVGTTGGDGGQVLIIDPADGSIELTLDVQLGFSGVVSVGFTPDGQRAAAEGGFLATVKFFDTVTGSPAGQVDDDLILPIAMSISPDGSRVALGSFVSGDVHVRLISDSALVQTLTGTVTSVWNVAYAPNGLHIAVSGDSTEIHSTSNGAVEHSFPSFTDFALAFSSDSTRVLAGGAESFARLFDVASGDLLTTFGYFSAPVGAVAFSTSGLTVATGAIDSSLRIWNAADGTLIHDIVDHADPVNAVAYSPDAELLASAAGAGGFGTTDPTVRVWNTATGANVHVLAGHSGGSFAVAFSPDGTLLASGGSEISGQPRGTLKIWQVSDGQLVRTIDIPQQNPINGVAWTTDGTLIATVHNDIRFWRVSDGGLDHIIAPGESLTSIAVSPDSVTVAGASEVFNTAKAWDIATGALVGSYVGPPPGVGLTSVAFSSDGSVVAAGSGYASSVYFWDFEGQSLLNSFDQECGWGISPVPLPIALAPLGTRFVYGRSDAAAVVADRATNLIGDLNCDGAVNPLDIAPFALALADPSGYEAQFPSCNLMLADVNTDGLVDGRDVPPFVGLLLP